MKPPEKADQSIIIEIVIADYLSKAIEAMIDDLASPPTQSQQSPEQIHAMIRAELRRLADDAENGISLRLKRKLR